MAKEESKPLSQGELAEIDAKYVSFPAFDEWPDRASGFDEWEAAKARFHEVSENASDADLKAAQEIALRTAAFDTGAIEGLYATDRGLTFTVATQAAAWEQEVIARSSEALDLFKAQLAAFELVLDLATEHFPEVTQVWMRRLHEEVTAAQETYVVHTPVGPQEQPLPKGEYKKFPNHVRGVDGRIHAYAPVEQTQSEMERLIHEVSKPGFADAHPILQASYLHYVLTVIHPFADGNGRVARAAASAYTYRAASVPLVVQAHEKDRYLADLARADEGDRTAFVEFIAAASRSGLEMMAESLETAQGPQPEQLLEEFREIYLGQENLTHHQLDELANEFGDSALDALNNQLATLSVPDGVKISSINGSGGNAVNPPEGFRKMVDPSPRFIGLQVDALAPANASLTIHADVFVSTNDDPAVTVLLRNQRTGKQLAVGLVDLQPQLSGAAQYRLENFLRRMIGEALDELLRKARLRLQRHGY
jgi:Fic family protein